MDLDKVSSLIALNAKLLDRLEKKEKELDEWLHPKMPAWGELLISLILIGMGVMTALVSPAVMQAGLDMDKWTAVGAGVTLGSFLIMTGLNLGRFSV